MRRPIVEERHIAELECFRIAFVAGTADGVEPFANGLQLASHTINLAAQHLRMKDLDELVTVNPTSTAQWRAVTGQLLAHAGNELRGCCP